MFQVKINCEQAWIPGMIFLSAVTMCVHWYAVVDSIRCEISSIYLMYNQYNLIKLRGRSIKDKAYNNGENRYCACHRPG